MFRNKCPKCLKHGQLNHLSVDMIEYPIIMSSELSIQCKKQLYWDSELLKVSSQGSGIIQKDSTNIIRLLALNKSFYLANCARKQTTEAMTCSKLAAIALDSWKQDNTSGTSAADIEQINIKFANSMGNKWLKQWLVQS